MLPLLWRIKIFITNECIEIHTDLNSRSEFLKKIKKSITQRKTCFNASINDLTRDIEPHQIGSLV